jgi:cytochrome c oxidase cbb3-type subunit 4
MEINDVRSAMTVIMFLVFLGIVVWAWSSKRRGAFDEAARLPFEEDEAMVPGEQRNASREHGA